MHFYRMKRLLIISVLGVSTFFVQCRSKKLTNSTMSNADMRKIMSVAKKRWPDIKQADIDSGRSIYKTKCTRCHGEKQIMSRTEVLWQSSINKMAPKAKLGVEQKELLTRYIFASREAGIN